jgi:hypothetical protein
MACECDATRLCNLICGGQSRFTNEDFKSVVLQLLCAQVQQTSAVVMPTLTPDRVEVTSGASIEVLPANASRVPSALIVNNTDESFFLQIGAAAIIDQGIPLAPHTSYTVDTKQQVQAIFTNAGTAFLDVYEAT